MVSFDLSPLTIRHLLSFGLTFVVTYFLLALSLQSARPFFRPVPAAAPIYYVGPLIATILSIATLVILGPSPLTLGLILASLIIILVGLYDETRTLSPFAQLLWQIIISALVVSWGWHIPYITNPLTNGLINLSQFTLGPLVIPGSILAVIWILILINSINWLDGLDGLAGSVSLVAFITLAAISLLPASQDSQTLLLAALGAGAVLGFLLLNVPPARVYLGTSGSWFLGLFIALTAINGGGKIATTLLVLSLPVIDFISVIVQRILTHQPPWKGDKQLHLHYRLRQLGLSTTAILFIFTAFSAIMGALAVTLQTRYKLIAFAISGIILAAITVLIFFRQTRSSISAKHSR